MAKPKKKRSRKGKIKISSKPKLRKKSEQPKDTIPRMQARPPADVAPVFRVKIRKK